MALGRQVETHRSPLSSAPELSTVSVPAENQSQPSTTIATDPCQPEAQGGDGLSRSAITSPVPVFEVSSAPFANSSDLPATELLYSLIDLYFKHVNTWCPILDHQFASKWLSSFPCPDDPDSVVLYAIVATALRFSQEPSLTPRARRQYYAAAKAKVILCAVENPSLQSLRALVILSFDFLGSSIGPQTVNIIALVVQTTLQLNLHLESTHSLSSSVRDIAGSCRFRDTILPRPETWRDEEGRRRLFWMAYIMERYVAVATGSDFVLPESSIDRSLPCRYDLFSGDQPVETRWSRELRGAEVAVNQPENLGSFSYHCEVIRILSRIHLFLQTPVDICSLAEMQKWETTYQELDHDLNCWLGGLPRDYSNVSQLCHSDPTSKISNWITLHAAFVTAIVRLHSCAAYPPVQSHLFRPSLSASQRCLAAVHSLHEIVQDVVDTGMLNLLGPQFALALSIAARVLLVHTGSEGGELDSSYEFFILTLQQMGQQWAIAEHCAFLLRKISNQARIQSLSNASVGNALSRMRMYVHCVECD
ncbi:fungal-specific transcription factor domain-containing protein [Aspergillus pseudoustus]|uniref:Fungal-specific transcription factor domain-containing protein n=1 Tax=Aspergillus pseudoustus TaxID=1810923 RepID=A0ABR4K0N7_9EURO